jgi:putative ABC transport system permease protein
VVGGAFAAATLLLVAVALYATLAYSVSSRAREFGIRAALGASAPALRRHVLLEGLRPAVTGLAVGLGAGALAASAARTLLFEVTPGDAATYVGTAAVVLIVATAACWGPARRSTRVDPSIALRAE